MTAYPPLQFTETCPRCLILARIFTCVDGAGLYRCNGCEWTFTMSDQSPTDTTNAAITAGSSVAISVASGGASFTTGMNIVMEPGTANSEIVVAGSGATGTSIPVPGGFQKSHNSAVAFGQLLLTPSQAAGQVVPPASPWPTLQPATF